MFSGIVEAQSNVVSVTRLNEVVRLDLEWPATFSEVSSGDSIAVNGVCLTVTEALGSVISFDLGPETLRVTGWTNEFLVSRPVNLERSLRLGDRLHGHWVLGHVDDLGTVLEVRSRSEAMELKIHFNSALHPFIWPKGSVTVNGVSLTINESGDDWFSCCLIPETLGRTNLGRLERGDPVTLEADNIARGLWHMTSLLKEVHR